MRKAKERFHLEGTKVGFWKVIHYKNHGYYLCACVCSVLKTIRGKDLKNGSTKSCGCMTSEVRASAKKQERKAPVSTCEPMYA